MCLSESEEIVNEIEESMNEMDEVQMHYNKKCGKINVIAQTFYSSWYQSQLEPSVDDHRKNKPLNSLCGDHSEFVEQPLSNNHERFSWFHSCMYSLFKIINLKKKNPEFKNKPKFKELLHLLMKWNGIEEV